LVVIGWRLVGIGCYNPSRNSQFAIRNSQFAIPKDPSMKIAHISDLHLRHHLPGSAEIAARRSREMPERFAAAINEISREAVDMLIITGDLLDYPLDAMHDPITLAQGEADLRLIAQILEQIDVPIALVHGNHDHPELVQRVFGHLPVDQEVAGHRVLCFFDNEGADHVPLRQGEDQQRFLAALADERSLPQIHVQHYIVWPELNDEYPHTYGQGAEMRDQIVESGRVRLVLSGHYHKGVPLFQQGQTYFTAVRAFTEEPHPYVIYQIAGDGMGWG
jgi:DNA repair exonuclease SbcCD nuclease subunit